MPGAEGAAAATAPDEFTTGQVRGSWITGPKRPVVRSTRLGTFPAAIRRPSACADKEGIKRVGAPPRTKLAIKPKGQGTQAVDQEGEGDDKGESDLHAQRRILEDRGQEDRAREALGARSRRAVGVDAKPPLWTKSSGPEGTARFLPCVNQECRLLHGGERSGNRSHRTPPDSIAAVMSEVGSWRLKVRLTGRDRKAARVYETEGHRFESCRARSDCAPSSARASPDTSWVESAM
jgi:hypothetical protein